MGAVPFSKTLVIFYQKLDIMFPDMITLKSTGEFHVIFRDFSARLGCYFTTLFIFPVAIHCDLLISKWSWMCIEISLGWPKWCKSRFW
jgi:hypothetical protein